MTKFQILRLYFAEPILSVHVHVRLNMLLQHLAQFCLYVHKNGIKPKSA